MGCTIAAIAFIALFMWALCRSADRADAQRWRRANSRPIDDELGDPGYCPYCGEPWVWVRPGKSQPTCDCQDDSRQRDVSPNGESTLSSEND